MYDEIDECLDQYDGERAYQLIKEDNASNAELRYRLAHACYILSNFRFSKENERYQLLKEAYMSCKSAYELNSNNAEILKWCAIITGTLAELRNLNDCERVIYVKEFKTYLDEALAGEPDSSVYHMNGRFCYRMATLTAEEKKSVMNAFHSLPTCTIDEALDNFYKAEVMNSGHIDNLMFLGKCYIAKGNASKAKKYLLPVVEITPTDEMDEALIAEVQELLDNIKEGNVQDENEENENESEENEDESEENEDESSDQTDFDELENSTDSTSNYSKEE